MELLYQDDRVLVCVKPAGVLSTDEPGGMPELLRAAVEDGAVRSVHRLDRAVGGLMVYARTRRAASDLGAQMAAGAFHKAYLAVVSGRPEVEEGTLRDFLHRDRSERRSRIVPEGTPLSQEALLDYRVLAVREGMSLLRVALRTGRTHQIRCQLSGHGWPIVGDGKYGGPPSETGVALWSAELAFDHPRTGERLRFCCRPPAEWPWEVFGGLLQMEASRQDGDFSVDIGRDIC